MLVLEQVLVIMILGEQQDKLPGKRNNSNKDNKSVVKTPSSVSMVKTKALSGATLQNLNPPPWVPATRFSWNLRDDVADLFWVAADQYFDVLGQLTWLFSSLPFSCLTVILLSFSLSVICDSWNLVDCSPQGFSVPGTFPGKNTGVGCHFHLQGIFLTPGIKHVSSAQTGDFFFFFNH